MSSPRRGLALALLFALPAAASKEQAQPSDALVESVGVNVHLDYGDTEYVTAFDGVKALVLSAGIRYLRVGRLQLNDGTLDPLAASMAEAGLRINFLADLGGGSPTDARDTVKAFLAQHPGAVTSVEGPNEPDGFWPTFHPDGYLGQGFPAGAVQFQRDLYATFKADPVTAPLSVYGIALGLAGIPPCSNSNALGNSAELEDSVDFANFHPYPGGNPWHPDFTYDFADSYYHRVLLPSAALDPEPVPGFADHDDVACLAHKPYGKKPLVASETGVGTFPGGVPERHLSAILPRILLENFRLGIRRSFLYEMADSGVSGGAFGLVHADLTPKPSYSAIKALLNQLADRGASFTPGALDYALAVSPVTEDGETFDKLEYVHHLLFQKRDGRFELVLWHEIATDITYPAQIDLAPPAIPGVLTLNQAFGSASVTTVDEQGTPSQVSVDPTQPIPLAINERFQIIELTPLAPALDTPRALTLPFASTVLGGCSAQTGLLGWLPSALLVLVTGTRARRRCRQAGR